MTIIFSRASANGNGFKLNNIRNNPAKQNLAKLKQHLMGYGPPNVLGEPAAFTQELLEIEQIFGTGNAALVGMLAAKPERPISEYIRGIDLFEQCYHQIPGFHTNLNPEKLGTLLRNLFIYLPFGERQNDFLLGLQSFCENLNGENNGVGTCVVSGGIAALLTLKIGYCVGAAQRFTEFHISAYFPKINFLFGVDDAKLYYGNANLDEGYSVASALSFSPSLIILEIAHQMANGHVPKKAELQNMMKLLATAEAINPQLACIHHLRGRVAKHLEMPIVAERSQEIWYEKLGQYGSW
jgi:hypothetical protein